MPLALSEDEREFVAVELRGAGAWLPTPELKRQAEMLVAAARDGEIPDDLIGPLEGLLRVAMDTGRIPLTHGNSGELLARRIYARLPHGRALREAAEAVSGALGAVTGQRIEELRVSTNGPHAHSVTVVTDQGRLVVEFDRHGARLRTVEIG